MKVLASEFLISAAELGGAPPADAPEAAFLGRSNVGKSSMINALLRRRKLARVSNTPGRTRLLNFFEARIESDDGARHTVSICDLPGYGYARAPHDEISRWQKMIEGYLRGRSSLRVAVSLIDARSGPTDLDLKLFAWLSELERRTLVVVTKIDKLTKSQRLPTLQAIGRKLGSRRPAMGFSSETGEGFDEVWAALLTHTS